MKSFFKKNNAHSIALNKNNYQSLLIALIVVLVPHFFYLPIMITVILVGILLVWQLLLWRKGHFKSAQQQWLKYFIVALSLTFIYFYFGTFFGVDAGCAVLAVILLGKSFEVKTYRDAIIQVNFALFVVASLFLYGQEIYLAVAALLGVIACFYSMYQLQNYNNAYEEVLTQDVSSQKLRQHAFKTVAKILLLATPLMILLFLFFPRIPPLWSIPQPAPQAKTGITDEISPGDIAKLSQSSDLAFRVVFNDFRQMPVKSELYWRALVLEDFDGIRWQQNYQTKFSRSIHYQAQSQITLPEWYSLKAPQQTLQLAPYRIIYEPTHQIWAYSLEHSVGIGRINLKPDLTLQFETDLYKRQTLNLQLLLPKPNVYLTLPEEARKLNSYIQDPTANPRSYALAKQMWQNHPDPKLYAEAILKWIRTENFSYTLSPPLLRGQRIDDFLFRTRAGFCEHYASAYANLMRMQGVPARVIVGYQGGQWAPDRKSWEIRQLDAHAWVEVWFKGEGWVRIDPTAAIAPERIELGMQQYSQQDQSVYGEDQTLWQAQRYQWMTKAKVWADYANYQWQSKVVGFDRSNQRSWLEKLSINSFSEQLLYLLVGSFIIIGLMIWRLSRQQKITVSALDKALLTLSNKLAPKQLNRLQNEPVLTWFKRIEQQAGSSAVLDEIIAMYTKHIYVEQLNALELNKLRKMLIKYTVD